MSFFNYPIYEVTDDSQKEAIALSPGINIVVKKRDYNDAAKTLLGKILMSVGQQLDTATLHIVQEDQMAYFKVSDANVNSLVLVFGLTPNECSLQLDKRQNVLFNLSGRTFLFSKALAALPADPEAKRALWTSLKEYYNL